MAEGSSNGASLAEVLALTGNRGGGWFGNNGDGVELLLFFLIFGMWGGYGNGGWGGNGWNNAGLQGALTRADLSQVAYDTALGAKIDNFQIETCNNFHNINTAMLQGFNHIQMQNAENRFAAQECCCTTNRNIDSIRFENAQNTAAIIQAGDRNTQRILDVMCENTIQSLRDKVAEKDQLLQSATNQISQLSQTDTIINRLQPTPIPAYLTCSPYQSSNAAYGLFNNGCGNGYGYGNGCGCGYGFNGF